MYFDQIMGTWRETPFTVLSKLIHSPIDWSNGFLFVPDWLDLWKKYKKQRLEFLELKTWKTMKTTIQFTNYVYKLCHNNISLTPSQRPQGPAMLAFVSAIHLG